MKVFFSLKSKVPALAEEDFGAPTLMDDIEKTRIALEIAYAGFDNATDEDMIDCYIYEINALLKRYKHLAGIAQNTNTATPYAGKLKEMEKSLPLQGTASAAISSGM